jgi:tryptophan-rich sensory protein
VPKELRHVWLATVLAAAAFVGASFAAAGVGQLLGRPPGGEWYDQLRKPSFTPPSWVFGPVWSVLYASMGVAAWLVWRRRGLRGGARPLGLFAVQLVLNAAWTPLFFGLRLPGAALIEIAALWAAVVVTTWSFFRVSRAAGALMVPYAAWVSFAAVLNFSIWRLNA